MQSYIRKGWDTTRQLSFIVLITFLYRFIWGVILFKLLQNWISPLLYRYPLSNIPTEQAKLFILEAQFVVTKTNFMHTYVYILIALFAIRLFITPFIQAGIFYTLANRQQMQRKSFMLGIKKNSFSFFCLYILQLSCFALPLWWFIPKLVANFHKFQQYETFLSELLPWIICWLLFTFLVKLFFMYMMFGITLKIPLYRSIFVFIRSFLKVVSISAILILMISSLSLIVSSTSFIWASFLAIFIHQAFHLVHSFFKIWEISAQLHLYSENTLN